jgi:hypothetical protein
MKQSFFALTAVLTLVACQPAAQAPEAPPAPAAETAPAQTGDVGDLPSAPAGELKATLNQANDITYPWFYLVLTPETGGAVGARFNDYVTEVPGGLEALVGKPVIAKVKVTEEVRALDVLVNGKSVLFADDMAKPVSKGVRKAMIGRLDGAAQTTQGDMPSLLTITGKDGPPLTFEYYVDDALVKVNGKEVTLAYEMQAVSTVVDLKAAP